MPAGIQRMLGWRSHHEIIEQKFSKTAHSPLTFNEQGILFKSIKEEKKKKTNVARMS